MARAKGFSSFQPKGKASRGDNAKTFGKTRQGVRVLSSKDSEQVGRPGGHAAYKSGPQDGKLPVKRLMRDDPSVGRTQPAADNLVADMSVHVDLIGDQSPQILAQDKMAPVNAGKKVVRPPRSSKPVDPYTVKKR